jgi:hypothetical protein
MILSLDNLAAKYHLLPSEALERATTFDLYVLDTSARWSKHQQDIADGKVAPKTSGLSVSKMQEMMRRAKELKQ